jgi:chain length determinant protein EpsF
VNIKQMIRVLWARRWLMVRVFASVVVLVLAVSLVMKKKYMASASVVVNSKTTDPVSGNEMPSDLLPSALATQIDIISSHEVAARVVDRLRLASRPDFRQDWEDATDGTGSVRDWIAFRLIKKNLLVEPSVVSNVIVINLLTTDPDLSVDMANAWAGAYIQTSLELKSEPAQRQAAWFDDQVNSLRRSLEIAQKRLSDYQRAQNVTGTDDRVDVENSRLQQIVGELVTAQAAMYDGQVRLKQMSEALRENKLEQLPEIIGNPLLQAMTADLARAEANLAQTAARFERNHPQYESAVGQVAALKHKITAEIENARGSIAKNTEISEKRVTELQTALEQQRDRVLSLKRQQDDIDVKKRDVDNAQRSYEAALLRQTQVQLEGRLDQSNVAVLSRAVPPFEVARPKILLNLALGIVFGGALAVAVALMAELSSRRVRAASDITDLSGIAVLAIVPASRKSRKRSWRFFLPSRRRLLLGTQGA